MSTKGYGCKRSVDDKDFIGRLVCGVAHLDRSVHTSRKHPAFYTGRTTSLADPYADDGQAVALERTPWLWQGVHQPRIIVHQPRDAPDKRRRVFRRGDEELRCRGKGEGEDGSVVSVERGKKETRGDLQTADSVEKN